MERNQIYLVAFLLDQSTLIIIGTHHLEVVSTFNFVWLSASGNRCTIWGMSNNYLPLLPKKPLNFPCLMIHTLTPYTLPSKVSTLPYPTSQLMHSF